LHDNGIVLLGAGEVRASQSGKWIAQAERWHELERAQLSWRKQKRALQQSMHAGPMTTQQRQLS